MLVSYISARAMHDRAFAAFKSAIATVEAQLARCHAASTSAAGADTEVHNLASGLLALGEAIDAQDSLIDPKKAAALVTRALLLQEEALNLQQAERRLALAMDGPLDSEAAAKALERALEAASVARVVDVSTMALGRQRLEQARKRQVQAAMNALSSASDVPLAEVNPAALQTAIDRARTMGVEDLKGAEAKLLASQKLLQSRSRLKQSIDALRKGGAQGAILLATAIEKAKESGIGGQVRCD